MLKAGPLPRGTCRYCARRVALRKTGVMREHYRRVACVHTWRDGDVTRHLHVCRDLASCHPAPCVCRCGARCYCTLHAGASHVSAYPKRQAVNGG